MQAVPGAQESDLSSSGLQHFCSIHLFTVLSGGMRNAGLLLCSLTLLLDLANNFLVVRVK